MKMPMRWCIALQWRHGARVGKQVPIELVGGPKDGLVMLSRPDCKAVVIPKPACSPSFGQWVEVEYRMRFEAGQPVTNRAGNLLFDHVGER